MEENQTNYNEHMANYKREELSELLQFLKFADDVNHKRELVKISLSYQHKRFDDNKGFAILQMKHKYAMAGINSKIIEAVKKEIEELEQIIKEYENK